jgi:hypothetical protein
VEPAGVPAITAEGTLDENSPTACRRSPASQTDDPVLQQLVQALDGLGRRPHVMASLADGIWVPLANASSDVSKIRVALQLADRRGHVTGDDLGAFERLVNQWAQGAGANVSAPDTAPYLRAARDLDRFCADVDVVVGLNVLAQRRPFSRPSCGVVLEAPAPDSRTGSSASVVVAPW